MLKYADETDEELCVLYVEGDTLARRELKRRLRLEASTSSVPQEEEEDEEGEAEDLSGIQLLLEKICRRIAKDVAKNCDVTDYSEALSHSAETAADEAETKGSEEDPTGGKGKGNGKGNQEGGPGGGGGGGGGGISGKSYHHNTIQTVSLKRLSPIVRGSVEVIEWATTHKKLQIWEEREVSVCSSTTSKGEGEGEGEGGKERGREEELSSLVTQLRLVCFALRNNASVRSSCMQDSLKLVEELRDSGGAGTEGDRSLALDVLKVIKKTFCLIGDSSKVADLSLKGSILNKGLDKGLSFFNGSIAAQLLVGLCAILRELVHFSISAREVWLWILQTCEGDALGSNMSHWRLLSLGEMKAVCCSAPSSEPESVFCLSGSMGGIICDGCAKWPFNNGFCFMTQICIDRFGNDLQYKPRLFTFLTADGQGIEGYFEGPFLTMALHTGRTGGSEVIHFKHAFRPRSWYTIAVQIARSTLGFAKGGDSKLTLWVDGTLMDSHSVDYQKIHKPLSAFCIGTRPPAIRGNHSFLSDAEESLRFNFKGLLGPIHIHQQSLAEPYLKRMVGHEVSCLPNGVLRISSALGNALQRRRSISGDAKGLNLLALYHPLLVRDSVCPNAVGIDLHSLSDYRQNQGHLSVSVTVFQRGLIKASVAACGQRLPQILISILNEKVFSKESKEISVKEILGIASHVVSILTTSVVATSGGGESLDTNIPLLLAGNMHLIVDKLSSVEESTVEVMTTLLSAISDLMDKTKIWVEFCKYLLFNRRIWEKSPAVCKVHILYIISRYCERSPSAMFEMGVVQTILSYLSECTFEYKRGVLSEQHFSSTYTAVTTCIQTLVLKGEREYIQVVIESCVEYMSSLSSTSEVENLIFLFEEVLCEADIELRKEISKALVQEKFVEVTLTILSSCEEKRTQHFCEVVMVHTIPLFAKILDHSQSEAETQFGESYYAMSNLISLFIFSKEMCSFIGTKEYHSILCSSLTNIKGSKLLAHNREQVLSGTCVLKNMIFLSPFVLGLHRLEFEIQEVMLHDLTFLFCTNAENRRIFTDWDEWYISMLLVYLNAWAKGNDGIMDSCINLIRVLAQHAYRGESFATFSHQIVCATLIIKTELYKDYLTSLGKSDIYAKIDFMTSSVIKQLLSFATEDLMIDQKPKPLPNIELCELNSLVLFILIDRFFSVLSLSSKADGQIDLNALSRVVKADWILVQDFYSKTDKGEQRQLDPIELAGLIMQQVFESTPVLPEKSKLHLICTYGSNQTISNVLSNLEKRESALCKEGTLDLEILSLALKNMDALIRKGNFIKHIYRDNASLLMLIPLTRLILVSWRSSEPDQRAQTNHLGLLEKILEPLLRDQSEKYQSISFALTIIVYEEAILSVDDKSFPLIELSTLLMKLVQKWQVLLQNNLLQDSDANRAMHTSSKINSLPAPLLLAQQNLLSLSPEAMKRTLDEVLRIHKVILGSEDLSLSLRNLLTIHEIKQSYVVHDKFVYRNFRDAEKESLIKESVVALANTVKEKKSHNSAKLHTFELSNQENIQLSHRLLFELLKKLSFDKQSSYASPETKELPPGTNRWQLENVLNSCRKRIRLTLCSGGSDYQPASEKNLKGNDKMMNMENLPPVSRGIPFFEDEEEEDDSESGSPRQSMSQSNQSYITSPGGSQRARDEETKVTFESFALLVTPTGTSLGWIDIDRSSIFFSSIDTEEEMTAFEEEGKTLPMSYMRSFVGEDGNQSKKRLEWHLDSLSLILVRRYCLRRSAIEFFLSDRTSYFFDFGSPDLRQKAYSALVSIKPLNLHPLCYYSQNPERLVKKSEITHQWVKREISNFEYLMYLNAFAGRSYNDITQYPIFPWVLSDYKSEEIDLSDPRVYRDLTKPVGALDQERLKKFIDRYHSFEDEMIPKFHYGSHYSSSGIVLFYLLRLEPFAGLAVSLQSGKFDHADRLFDDLPATWQGCLSDMSDVKELIPEFFYCPEVLKNVNNFNLGTRQDGKKLGDVTLPPWASDAAEFISIHQQALESEYVSNNLHHWIDLVFGSKQRGQEAVDACNVFFYMTYEGQVDIDAITDPMQQKAALDQIAHFGQTPYQLFKEGHPCRMPMEESICPLFSTPSAVRMYEVDIGSSDRTSIGQMLLTSESIVMVSSLYPYSASIMDFQANTPDSSGLPFSGKKSKSKAFTAISSLSQKLSAVTNLLDNGLSGWSTNLSPKFNFKDCFAISENGRFVFSCGHPDYTIRLCDVANGKPVEVLRGLQQPSCLKLSKCGSVLVVGFRNSTVGVWIFEKALRASSRTNDKMHGFFFNSKVIAHELLSEQGRKEETMRVDKNLIFVNTLSFCCGAIKCIDVSIDLDTVVALTYSEELVYHSLSGDFFARVCNVRADAVFISNESVVVVDKCNFRIFSMNGELLRKSNINDLMHLQPLSLSNTGKYLALCGYNKDVAHCCVLVVYDTLSMKSIFQHDLKESYVASCAFSKDDTNLIAVLDDGEVMVFTDPATSLKLVDQMLRLGWQESGLEALQ